MKKIGIFVLLAFFISFVACGFAREPGLWLHFIDAGEGDSVFIEAPGGETALVDAGNLISGYRVVEYLKEKGIRSSDYLIFTHPHLDHIGGAFFVMQMMDAEDVFDNGEDLADLAKSLDVYRWYEDLVRSDENYKTLKAGDSLLLGEVTLNVLWPPQPPVFPDFNANSLVIMVEYGEFRCLLTGDLTAAGERKLLEQGANLKADVLKVGHHGAGDASSGEFLAAVSPKTAIISVDKENARGYPSEEVINRLRSGEADIYRTDRDGDIVLGIYAGEGGKTQVEVKAGR